MGENVKEDSNADERLRALEANQADSQTLANMMADPDIRQILAAREQGIDVVVGPKEAEKSSIQEDLKDVAQPVNFDEMSNKQIVEHVTTNVAEAVEKAVQGVTKPFEEKIAVIEKHVQATVQQNVSNQIEDAKKRHPDFDKHRQDMFDLHKENPALKVEQLYVLAKMKSGVPLNEDKSLASEKPTHEAAGGGGGEKPQPVPPTRRGWDALVAKAQDKGDYSSFGQ